MLPAQQVEWILKPLRDLGCYAGLHCDLPLTMKMVNHPRVAATHITGSLAAHDAICWGPKVCLSGILRCSFVDVLACTQTQSSCCAGRSLPLHSAVSRKVHPASNTSITMKADNTCQMTCAMQEEREQRRAASNPALKAPLGMTSELGNVTPAIIAPAKYTPEQLQALAGGITFNASDNAGCNCLAPKVVLFAAEWPQVCIAVAASCHDCNQRCAVASGVPQRIAVCAASQ